MYCFESFTSTNDGDINENESDSKENNKEIDNNEFDMTSFISNYTLTPPKPLVVSISLAIPS